KLAWNGRRGRLRTASTTDWSGADGDRGGTEALAPSPRPPDNCGRSPNPTLRPRSIMNIPRRSLSSLALFLAGSFVAPLALAAQSLVSSPADLEGMSAQRLDRLSVALEQYVEEGSLAGAVTLVARNGRILFLQAVGHRDREAGDVMEVDD